MTKRQALKAIQVKHGPGAYASEQHTIGFHTADVYSVGVYASNTEITHHGMGKTWEEAIARMEPCQ